MRIRGLLFLISLSALAMHTNASNPCAPGAYRDNHQQVIVLSDRVDKPEAELGYLMLDGRYGNTGSGGISFQCENNLLTVAAADSSPQHFTHVPLQRTSTTFTSVDALLVGELIEPADNANTTRPLVVMVQGSERSAAIGNSRATLLAGMGISVFVYDKRGTGKSEGLYTQNFNLLAEDAAAALAQARKLAAGRFGRSGYWGASQGGWIAPLAATRAQVDFIVVGYGLVASPIEEDLDQMLLEAQQQHIDAKQIKQLHRLSNITAKILLSHFADGLQDLQRLRKEVGREAWFNSITGEYSGAMLRMNDADLRRLGPALFDNLELIWNYDSAAALKNLKRPLLWVIAQNDREAPIQRTLQKLTQLKHDNPALQTYLFPNTDHGMYEYNELPDGSRKHTRVTDGYFSLVAGWILQNDKPYAGQATLINQ